MLNRKLRRRNNNLNTKGECILYFPIPFLILVLTVFLIAFFISFVVGYYQPAGPLINSHLVPQSQTVPTKAGSSGLDGDSVQLQLQSPATSGTENTEREVLITGKRSARKSKKPKKLLLKLTLLL